MQVSPENMVVERAAKVLFWELSVWKLGVRGDVGISFPEAELAKAELKESLKALLKLTGPSARKATVVSEAGPGIAVFLSLCEPLHAEVRASQAKEEKEKAPKVETIQIKDDVEVTAQGALFLTSDLTISSSGKAEVKIRLANY